MLNIHFLLFFQYNWMRLNHQSHVLAGDHPKDVKVLRTVRQRQFDFHAVVIGIGEDAVLRYILYRRPLLQRCLFSVYRQYHKEDRLVHTKVSQPIRP